MKAVEINQTGAPEVINLKDISLEKLKEVNLLSSPRFKQR